MIKKLRDAAPRVTRQQLVDPQAHVPHAERLARARAVDLRDNHVIEHTAEGYAVVRPVDPNRRFGE